MRERTRTRLLLTPADSNDISYYYADSYGNPYGAAQGAAWVSELLARLTGNLTFVTQLTPSLLNQTADASNATFPIGQAMYADFDHDDRMSESKEPVSKLTRPAPIFTALGLYNGTALNATVDPNRAFRVSRFVPFAGRLHVERISCTGETEPAVRLIVNDEVQTLGRGTAGC